MLSKSGLTIRKLIPHRRSDEDMGIDELNREDNPLVSWMNHDGVNAGGEGRVYTAKRHSGTSKRRRRTPGPIIATSPLTHSDILRPLPPLPSETPRSSASSSCRCERHVECDCPLLSWKRRSPRYSTSSSKGDGEEPSLLACVSAGGPVDTLAQHNIPRSRFYLSNDPQDKGDMALALSFEERREEAGTKDRSSEEDPCQKLSEDIQQFLQETEDAFKSIGSTFSAAQEPTPPTPPPKETTHIKTPSERTHSTLGSPSSNPPDGTTPLQKQKMRRSRKSKPVSALRPTRKFTTLKNSSRSGSRWTLSENVSGLLSRRLFRGVEADEMLTPDQIEAFKQQRITKLQVDKMAEALERELEADAPLEHLDLDELPSRSGSADSKTDTDIETLAAERRTVSFSEGDASRQLSDERQRGNDVSSPPAKSIYKAQTFPIGSSRHRRSSSRKLMTELPSIPESQSTSEYVYLKSSVRSLTTPGIRHGAIRLSKSDLVKLGGDDGLDWTAFQMAILGVTENASELRQQEEEEIADITDWVDSWLFEGTGKLVTPKYEASSPTNTLSGDEMPDLSYSEIESDSPHSPQRRLRDSRRKSPASTTSLQLDHNLSMGGKPVSPDYFADRPTVVDETWAKFSEREQIVESREGANSLPPSPMLDLRVIRSDKGGDDMDVVPMGYNLGHDLGDFLKWEAEHAYAGDFNSPPLI
ncbi:hypothetical protein F5Y14DRAFT_410030 [Nemania sp. NC0429]|nr:hypothetical protein F5Y14DRAFT_410030 [Nemania sp. NC0429]